MVISSDKIFILHTAYTTYAFHVMDTGHLEHLYYGKRITIKEPVTESSIRSLLEKRRVFLSGNCNAYDEGHATFTLEDAGLEMSSYGKGDIWEPFVEVVHADGSVTSDFLFDSAVISKGKNAYETLPGSYDESGEADHLCVFLKDKNYDLTMELHYYVYEDCDVIARSTRLVNNSSETIRLTRLMSSQLDFDETDFVFTTFNGAWGREMKRTDSRIVSGKHVNSSYTGTSSSRANPFVMLSKKSSSEDLGDCYGFNLIYSGNHYEAVEVSAYGRTRIVTGINPSSFEFVLEVGLAFEAPEAVMAYSGKGYNGMSQCMHQFVREHIVRGEWKKKARPVLLNSWEAAYFDINEEKLLRLARAGRDAGIELFVMDDGWFGKRNDDTSSLGDWQVNTDKLQDGVTGLCEKINAMGLDFGIWVEPEMVNVDSELYLAHPDWVMDIPDKPHSEGRHQRILDLCRTEVQDYIITQMSNLFASANIAYVKWDMNRTVSDYFSRSLPAKRQGEVAHRYVMGLYRCLRVLTERFPHILFEGCSSGGNRSDLGILCYFPQIWASDNTDAVCRAEIQTGYSYGYPMSAFSAHVSACPNHQTQRNTPLATRFHVAAFGIFGYECNFCEMDETELEEIKEQIALYKKWRDVLQFGRFYRGRTVYENTQGFVSCLGDFSGNVTEWTCVAEDQNKAVGLLMQKLFSANVQREYYRAKGLKPDREYHFYNGEAEDCFAYGDSLMYCGVKLEQKFPGGGEYAQVSYYQDFGTGLYFMEQEGGI